MISNKYKFIYIAIARTGTTSIIESLHKTNLSFTIPSRHNGIKYHHKKFPKKTKNYFKFAFVRNPWDRLVSTFFRRKSVINAIELYLQNNFRKFLDSIVSFRKKDLNYKTSLNNELISHKILRQIVGSRIPMSQISFLTTKKGNMCMDFIGRFENLKDDFEYVCDKIKIPYSGLTHRHKTNHKHYSEYYDDEMKNIVADMYKDDIEYFKYKF